MMRSLRLALAVCFTLATASSLWAKEEINWAPNLQAAVNAASRQNQLVLLHFWAPGCQPCRMLDQNVFSRRDVADAIHRDYVPLKVNAASMPELADQYGVDRWPMDVIITPAGYALHKMVSPQDPKAYMTALGKVASTRRPGGESVASVGTQAPAIPPPVGQAADPRYGAQQQPQNWGAPQEGGSSFSRFSQDNYNSGYAEQGAPPQGQPQGQQSNFGDRYESQYQAAPAEQAPPAAPQDNPYASGAQNGWNNPRGAVGIAPDASAPQHNPYMQNPQGPPGAPGQQSQFGPPQEPSWGTPPGQAAPGQVPPGQQPNFGPPTGPGTVPGQGPIGGQGAAGAPAPVAPQQQPLASGQPSGPQRAGAPPLGLDGFCPVTLAEDSKWQQGDKRFGIIHRGKLYLFASDAQKQKFWQSPDKFAPILSGNDPVEFVERGSVVNGDRKHGVFFRNQIYLFASEENLQRFWTSPQRYADVAYQAMQQSSGTQRR